jgi:peptide chain release factor subunit 1
VQLEITSRDSLVEYLAENYREWGADLQFITDRSQEGSQFCRGFGGIGGLLRWKIDFQDLEVTEEYVSGDDDEDFADAFI